MIQPSTLFWTLVPLQCLSLGALACSRVNYNSGEQDGNRIVVGRSMDWMVSTNSSLYAFPAGMNRTGAAGNHSLSWQTKYGSVITTGYDISTCDGMNSEGLVGNLLYLADSDYGARNQSIPALTLGLAVQYFLDLYPNVSAAVQDLYQPDGSPKFQVRTEEVIPGVHSTMHVALSDSTGDSAILEWINGKLVVHHSPTYTVMTNEPPFDQQLAIDAYWDPISNFSLPGTDRPADRFARLAHYNRVAPDSADMVSAVATTAGMVRAVSVPLEPTAIDNPNIAPTIWRTYADTKSKTYFFEDALQPMFFWVDFADINLSANGTVMKLPLNVTWSDRVGDMSKQFKQASAYVPMPANN
ncbi:hypothetical protein LTR99_007342 [Exophiala xenobiotica]|uniref:Choloylglycine hydrolase/NAAA C-terminal domain-containing protein n=1 Tax=Vermiconidia calcicola TaxID=1690605 RepID=A0AAV9Q442_9PEZI|nr:hypothetical protein LTR92_002652 [Exophiala xenobiotica]KAK5534451.1 hypothetical protein LTR25_006483 [Vermiconidia calcicola]KAK5544667.1 hypothetical protein LTR23_004431 [Chaetothyriales sp. CCFEE 6169]KAK5266730.1 hypothetical protein LTR96_007980 [Exophiala xenobiotica]KAK5299074.1 hypothetical protein LTR99_007342 [Exophiala xenobiotica]